MAENILYFPYIHLPNNKWLYRSLLYWDQLGTIIPIEFDIPRNSLTQQLFDLKLAVPIHPEEIIYKRKNYVTNFMEFIDDQYYPVKPGALTEGAKTTKIHMSKMIDIFVMLEERGLAKMESGPWCNIESYTAAKFMAYLAGVVGGKKDMTPTTDNIENLSSFMSATPDEIKFQKKLALDRIQVMDNILPVPSIKPNLKRLAVFKENHREELISFREHIEHFIVDLQSFSSQAAKDKKIEQFKKDFYGEVTRIKKKIEENRILPLEMGTILSLSSASFGTATALMATGPGALFGAIAATLGLAGTGYTTYKKFKDSKEEMKQSFAAYAIKYEL